jgi:hypothetical protein
MIASPPKKKGDSVNAAQSGAIDPGILARGREVKLWTRQAIGMLEAFVRTGNIAHLVAGHRQIRAIRARLANTGGSAR